LVWVTMAALRFTLRPASSNVGTRFSTESTCVQHVAMLESGGSKVVSILLRTVGHWCALSCRKQAKALLALWCVLDAYSAAGGRDKQPGEGARQGTPERSKWRPTCTLRPGQASDTPREART
jgi:hypothetical protein